MVETRAAKFRRIQANLPSIPPGVTADHVLPFLDRSTWNNLSVTKRDYNDSAMAVLPPWPRHVEVCQSRRGDRCGAEVSPNAVWMVSSEMNDTSIEFRHCRLGHIYTGTDQHRTPDGCGSFSPTNSNILASASDTELVIWDLHAANKDVPPTFRRIELPLRFPPRQPCLLSMDWSPDGRILVIKHFWEDSSDDTEDNLYTTFSVWSVNQGAWLQHWASNGFPSISVSCYLTDNGDGCNVASYDVKNSRMEIWNVDMTNRNQITSLDSIESAKLDPTDSILLDAGHDPLRVVLDVLDKQATKLIVCYGLQTGSLDDLSKFWLRDVKLFGFDGVLQKTWAPPTCGAGSSWIPVEDLSNSGIALVAAYEESTSTAYLYNVFNETCIQTIENEDPGAIEGIKILPLGKTMHTYTNEGHCRFHEVSLK